MRESCIHSFPALLLISTLGFWRGAFASPQNSGQNDLSAFTIVGGQIYTPGLAIIDSPQPFTPMGGDFLQLALDVTGDGRIPQPPNNEDKLTQIFNITVFLTSNSLNKNFTISNGTGTVPPLAAIMSQEEGSTVKHVNFEWPDCLAGDGSSNKAGTARGNYNISIHQNYKLNGTNFYTIFNLPVATTNSIPQFPGSGQLLTKPNPGPLNTNGGRMPCNLISNPLLTFDQLLASVNNPPQQPYLGGAITLGSNSNNNNGGGGGGGSSGGNSGGQIGANGQGEIGKSAGITLSRPGKEMFAVAIGVLLAIGS